MAVTAPSFVIDQPGFRTALYLRLAVLAAILLSFLALSQATGASPEIFWLVALVAFDFLLSGPYWWAVRRWPDHLPTLALGILLVEVFVVTVGEYLLGPDTAVYGIILYSLLIVAAAFLHSNAAGYFIGVASVASYTLLVGFLVGGWIPEYGGPFGTFEGDSRLWSTAVVNTTTSLTFGIFAGVIANTLRGALSRSHGLEADLRELNRTLEGRVEEGLRGITARNEELQRRTEQVELFARAVAHDLRNPLTAASEALRLRETSEEDSREELVAMSRENLLRADRMLIGLRDLMRTAATQPEPELVQVSAILEEVVRELALTQRRDELPIQFVSDFDDILARSVQLTHLFRNLLSNALEHNSDQPDLRIEVGQEMGEESDLTTTFFVRDNGKGVAPELQERIFAPFRRGPGSPESGLGLGLALVDAIVTQAGGKVWVEEAPGGGAAFCFTLLSVGSRGGP